MNMGFSVLTNALNGMALRGGLFDAQALAYRKITSIQWRDTVLPVGEDEAVYDLDNDFYDALKDKFDDWNSEAVERELRAGSDLAQAVNSVVKIRGKSIKRAKKQSTRVMREVNKMWKQGYYGEENKELRHALDDMHRAFRESFVNIRFTLREDAYNCIPKDLSVTLKNGDKLNVSSLYTFDEAINKYRMQDNVHLSATDLRLLQLTIAPYIFAKIYGK